MIPIGRARLAPWGRFSVLCQLRALTLSLKRQLPVSDLRKVLAIKRFVAAGQITLRICPAAPHLSLAQAFANLSHAQPPFQGLNMFILNRRIEIPA